VAVKLTKFRDMSDEENPCFLVRAELTQAGRKSAILQEPSGCGNSQVRYVMYVVFLPSSVSEF
jgi:hypothetical protein